MTRCALLFRRTHLLQRPEERLAAIKASLAVSVTCFLVMLPLLDCFRIQSLDYKSGMPIGFVFCLVLRTELHGLADTVAQFGITVNPKPVECAARILEPPNVLYDKPVVSKQ